MLRTNLIYNPSFEVNVTDNTFLEDNLTSETPVLSRDTGTAAVGSASAKIAIPASAQTEEWRVKLRLNNTNEFTLDLTKTYKASIYIKTSDSRNCKLSLEGPAGVYGYYSSSFATTTDWVRYTLEVTPVAGELVDITFNVFMNDGNAGDVWIDGAMVETVSGDAGYYDGSSATTSINSYAWDGTAHNSISYSYSVPDVTTSGASSIGADRLTAEGEITDTGGKTVTRRGFQVSLSAFPDQEIYQDGTFTAEEYSQIAESLASNTLYYIRAFAVNEIGTGYGNWASFTTITSQYSITIAGIDRKTDVLNQTITVEDAINDKQNILSLSLIDRSGNGIPSPDEEIIITLPDGDILFGGFIISVDLGKRETGAVVVNIQAMDYARLLDRNLVHRTFENMTDKAIIEEIISIYCAGSDITTTNVLEGVTIDQISFNYIQVSQALRKICDLTGRNWYIDYEKDIHYFPLTTNTAPFNITTSNTEYINLKISKDASQIKNRVYVRGGTKLSDFTTYSEKGDAEKVKFVIPDKPHDVSITVNGASKSLGIKNIDTTGYDWYLNFQEKYVEQDSGGAVLGTSDILEITYKYDIPILVALENAASILEHGVQEFAIFDKQIATTQAARDRATAELTDYANNIIEGGFETYTSGFVSGQYININLSDYEVNADYIIQKVVARSMGGGKFVYEISLASAKTMGIIRFLIELLETNRNIIVLDDNEVVDELFTINDALLSDSLQDALTIDSAGPYRTWCVDSLDSSPITRAIWNLFEWGGNG